LGSVSIPDISCCCCEALKLPRNDPEDACSVAPSCCFWDLHPAFERCDRKGSSTQNCVQVGVSNRRNAIYWDSLYRGRLLWRRDRMLWGGNSWGVRPQWVSIRVQTSRGGFQSCSTQTLSMCMPVKWAFFVLFRNWEGWSLLRSRLCKNGIHHNEVPSHNKECIFNGTKQIWWCSVAGQLPSGAPRNYFGITMPQNLNHADIQQAIKRRFEKCTNIEVNAQFRKHVNSKDLHPSQIECVQQSLEHAKYVEAVPGDRKLLLWRSESSQGRSVPSIDQRWLLVCECKEWYVSLPGLEFNMHWGCSWFRRRRSRIQ